MGALPLDPSFIGRTFDDFLFRPQLGVVASRREVALTSRLTAGLKSRKVVVSRGLEISNERPTRAG